MLRRFLKLFSLRNWNIALRYLRSYQKFLSENVMTGGDTYISDSRIIQGYLYFLCIYCITLFEIIPEIVFGKPHDRGLNSFIQKDCVIVYRCVTGNHTRNYFLITSCLSVTFPPRIVVLKLSNKAWFLRQEVSNFHRFNCQVLLRSYSFDLPLQRVNFLFENGVFESKTCKQYGHHQES